MAGATALDMEIGHPAELEEVDPRGIARTKGDGYVKGLAAKITDILFEALFYLQDTQNGVSKNLSEYKNTAYRYLENLEAGYSEARLSTDGWGNENLDTVGAVLGCLRRRLDLMFECPSEQKYKSVENLVEHVKKYTREYATRHAQIGAAAQRASK